MTDIPKPPDQIIDAALDGKLVLFVGAGLSRLCGSPGWEGFSHAILRWLNAKNLINHSVRMQLTTLPLKTQLSIALSIAKQNGFLPNAEDYREMLMTRVPELRDLGHRLYRNLTSMSKYCVTTNYDEWLEYIYDEVGLGARASTYPPRPSRPLVCLSNDFTIPNMVAGRVVHLHGSLTNAESMVLTTSDYLRHYRNDEGTNKNPVTSFLKLLFWKGDWTVLFIGYGLDEMEILEYVFQKSHVMDGESPPPSAYKHHYLLRGFYSYEDPLVAHLEKYFLEHCGVELIPFSLDGKDHLQMESVVADWAKQIKSEPIPPLEKRAEFEKLLDN